MLRRLRQFWTSNDPAHRLVRRAMLAGISVVVVFLSLVAAWWAMEYYQARALLDVEIAHIRARGEPLHWLEVRETYSSPSGSNAALDALIERAASLSQDPDYLAGNWRRGAPEASIEEMREGIRPYHDLFPLIAEAIEGPPFGWPVEYERPPLFLIASPHLEAIRPIRDLLITDLDIALADGDISRALQRFVESLALVDLFRDDVLGPSHTSRARLCWDALDRLQKVLPRASESDFDLVQLDERIATTASQVDIAPILQGERALLFTVLSRMGEDETIYLVRGTSNHDGLIAIDASDPPTDYIVRLLDPTVWQNKWWGAWPSRPWLLREQAFHLQAYRELGDVIERPYPVAHESLQIAIDEQTRQAATHPLAENTTPYYWVDPSWHIAVGLEQRLMLARLALRLHTYRDEHGHLPESLEQLRDDQLAAIPNGLISGEPLRYEFSDDHFVLSDPWPPANNKARSLLARFEVRYSTPADVSE